MPSDVSRLADLLKFKPDEGTIALQDRRVFLMEVEGFGLLRQELVQTLGEERAWGLLFRFGYAFGVRGAQALKKDHAYSSPEEWWRAGPPLRATEGLALVLPRIVQLGRGPGAFRIELVLKNSLEAPGPETPLQRCACSIMSGAASGHASTCFGEPILFIEETCVARGGPECVLVGKRVSDWGTEAQPYLKHLEGESVDLIISRLQGKLETLQAEVETRCSFSNIVGRSPQIVRVLEVACDVARTEATVLLLGESGTGKELLARAIHYNSRRSKGPFLAVNCAALHDTLLESELFGFDKGAFTGADRTQPGKFERAAGGTLFLDEIGDMALATQAKVLRVLQEREYERVGGSKVLQSDVRLLTATNRDLQELVREKKFREDLFYRINVLPVTLPPLRERRADILPLSRHFLQRFSAETGTAAPALSQPVQDLLLRYSWPGNVRELQNAIERAVILSRGREILAEHLGMHVGPLPAATSSDFELPDGGIHLEEAERAFLTQAMDRSKGNKTGAAKLLGLSRSALRYRLKKFGLDS